MPSKEVWTFRVDMAASMTLLSRDVPGTAVLVESAMPGQPIVGPALEFDHRLDTGFTNYIVTRYSGQR